MACRVYNTVYRESSTEKKFHESLDFVIFASHCMLYRTELAFKNAVDFAKFAKLSWYACTHVHRYAWCLMGSLLPTQSPGDHFISPLL